MYGSHGGIKLLPEKIKKTLWVHGLSILLNTTVETTVFQGNLFPQLSTEFLTRSQMEIIISV